MVHMHDASKVSLRSVLMTMFGNKGEGLLQACISSGLMIKQIQAKNGIPRNNV